MADRLLEMTERVRSGNRGAANGAPRCRGLPRSDRRNRLTNVLAADRVAQSLGAPALETLECPFLRAESD